VLSPDHCALDNDCYMMMITVVSKKGKIIWESL